MRPKERELSFSQLFRAARPLVILITSVLISLHSPCLALSEMVVHDIIAVRGGEAMLKVETRGKLFRRGGEVVEFSVDGKSAGKTLSGGDGFAFRQFKPLKVGLYTITAKSGNEQGKGILLSVRKGERILFVEVKGGLFEGAFSERPRKGSQDSIKKLTQKFPVVLLQTDLLDVKTIRNWLKENGYISLPVIPWDRGTIFDEIKEKGLKVKAVVGSRSVIESAKGYRPKAFSFEEVEGAEEVKDWKEIGKKLK